MAMKADLMQGNTSAEMKDHRFDSAAEKKIS